MATYDETAVGPATPMGAGAGAHDNQIVAMFDTYQQARAARDKLASSGVEAGQMDILDRNAGATDASFAYDRNSEGFWGAMKRFFVPEEDSHGYAEGLERGHAMLVVRVQQPAQREQIVSILESFEPIDFDARENEWKQSGWSGAYAGARSSTDRPVVIPPASATTPVSATSSGAAPATGTAPTTGTAFTTGTASTAAASTQPATARATAGSVGNADQDRIQVLEENLRVGKREVGAGRIRVRSYVVERPVEEQVTLREERVTLDRHPVDRPVGAVGTDAFRERTIDVTATSEEAVVAKDVRVVEEIGLRKDTSQRTETVKDSVRRTEVEVEDDTKAAGTTTATTPAPGPNTRPEPADAMRGGAERQWLLRPQCVRPWRAIERHHLCGWKKDGLWQWASRQKRGRARLRARRSR